MRRGLLLAVIGLILPILSAPAHAQATRTWVSGVGDDANPCSRTAPCKTFAGAISKTAPAGEINCLDPGGFGAVTITKAITISCEIGTAGVLVSGTNGIIISAGANDNIVLRGLDFVGLGTGINGIRFLAGKSLLVDHCFISGFTSFGIDVEPSTIGTAVVKDTTINFNGNGATGGGINAAAQAGGFTRIVLSNVTLDRNVAGVVAAGAATSQVEIYNSVIANSAGIGLNATGTGSIRVGHSVITGGGAAATSGNVTSFGNNQILDNATDTTPPTTALK
jgi:hypothetical protein